MWNPPPTHQRYQLYPVVNSSRTLVTLNSFTYTVVMYMDPAALTSFLGWLLIPDVKKL